MTARRRAGTAAVALVVSAVLTLLVGAVAAPAASAQEDGPLSIVHREGLEAGPYELTVGFTEWPMAEDRSLDVVFVPEDGVDAVRGTVVLTAPSGAVTARELLRHPRMRQAHGLDVHAFAEEGRWSLRFDLEGDRGSGSGTLVVPVGPRPGPPELVGWLPTLAGTVLIVAFTAVWWRRYRRESRAESTTW